MADTDLIEDVVAQDPPAVKRPWVALSFLLLALSMIIIDASLVSVLLPDMVNDLGLSQTDGQWVNSIYSLLFASLLITVGLLADKFGRRLLLLLGIVVFLLGSIGSGLSTSPEMLIAFRAVQAVGGACMMPSALSMINVAFVGPQRATAFGMFGAVFGGAAALGPLLGGWLAQDYSWRWAFFINVPIAIVAFIGLLSLFPESKVAGIKGFDFVGMLLSFFGLSSIVFALIEGQQYGWWHAVGDFVLGPINFSVGGISVVPVLIALGISLLVGLVIWESHRTRTHKTALFKISLFNIRRFGYGNVVALIVALGEFGILFVLPLWLESVGRLSPLQTGSLVAFLAVGSFIAGGSARHLAVLIGPTRLVRWGMVIEIVGVVLIGMAINASISPWWLVPPLVLYGIGLGLDSAQLTNVVLEDIPLSDSGQASAMNSTFRQVGSALGGAIVGAVLFTGLATSLSHRVVDDPGLTAEQQSQIVSTVRGTSGQAITQMQKDPALATVTEQAREAFTDAAHITAGVCASLIFLGLLFSFGLPKDGTKDEEGEVAKESSPATA